MAARHTGHSARTLASMSPAARAATLPVRRSARFVAWVRAWRAGLVPYDDAAAEIAGDEEHMVADAPGTWTDVSLAEGISAMSKLHPDEVRLVLPAPGDPRGLPGPGEFSGAALVAGEASSPAGPPRPSATCPRCAATRRDRGSPSRLFFGGPT